MRPTLFPLAAALGLVGMPIASASDSRIADWPQGEATIYTHTSIGPVPAGTISADGRVSIDLPTPPSGGQSLGDTFPSCHEDGAAIADPVFTEFFPTSLFVAHGEEEKLGSLRLATSRDVAAWQDSYGESPAAKGAWFQWIRVTQDATVEAECRTTMHTGEGDESFEIVTEYRVAFAPEWNLMRNDIQTLHTSPSGKTQPARTQVTALQALPEDAAWHFFGN